MPADRKLIDPRRPVEGDRSYQLAGPDIGPDWIPDSVEAADAVVADWTKRKVDALLRERGLDDEVETTRQFVAQTIPEYADRFLLELIQNAHDAIPPQTSGRIRVELHLGADAHDELLVANTGTPFRFRDFRSLCRMAQSEKCPGEGIGHKGVGFKSVLQVAPQPQIFSVGLSPGSRCFDGFRFTFPDEADYEELFSDAGEDVPRMTPYSLPVPIDSCDEPPSVANLALDGYVTVIRLPLTSAGSLTATKAVEGLLSSTAPALLFLSRVSDLIVVIHRGEETSEHHLTRDAERIASGDFVEVELVNLHQAGRFLVATAKADEESFLSAIAADFENRRVDERWHEWTGRPEVGVAVPLDDTGMADDRLFCYLPMQESAQSPVAGHINGPFAIGLARMSLIPNSEINRLLLDLAADICVDAALALKKFPGYRQVVVDLVAWPRDSQRIVSAWHRRGEDPATVEVLPCLQSRSWSPFAGSWCWNPEGTAEFTAIAVAATVDDPLIDPAIGQRRLDAIQTFGREALDLYLEPSPERLAIWAEAVASRLHRRERQNTRPLSVWLDFYDDLDTIFPETSGRALGGKRIILDDRKKLVAAWSDSDVAPRRRSLQRGVFFARAALDDPDEDATDEVPSSLRQALALVHPDLNWYVPGEAIRRNRPGRVFLEQQHLVLIPRVDDLLRLVEKKLAITRSARVWRDALIFVYRITRPGPRRPDLTGLGLERLEFRVPAGGAWIPARSALFSRGWTELGGHLTDLVESANSVSPEVAGLSKRLLDPPDSWIPKGSDVQTWIELLRNCGVKDGLIPVALEGGSAPPRELGRWWSRPENLAEYYRIPSSDREAWVTALRLEDWPGHPDAEYNAAGSPHSLPGQSDFAHFSERAKTAYANLVLAGLRSWPADVFSFRVHRRYNQWDPKDLPSPLRTFLASAPWVPVSKPGGDGHEDWVPPRDAWLVGGRSANLSSLLFFPRLCAPVLTHLLLP